MKFLLLCSVPQFVDLIIQLCTISEYATLIIVDYKFRVCYVNYSFLKVGL